MQLASRATFESVVHKLGEGPVDVIRRSPLRVTTITNEAITAWAVGALPLPFGILNDVSLTVEADQHGPLEECAPGNARLIPTALFEVALGDSGADPVVDHQIAFAL